MAERISKLLGELKRRRVFRAAVAYLLGAWAILQVAAVLAPALQLPNELLTGLVIVLAVAFAPAMVLAWALDLTPRGFERTAPQAAAAPAAPAEPPSAPAGARAVPKNLPLSPTRFVGRAAELQTVRARLLDSSVRLVTLTGLGGTGKSRLALEAARHMLDDFADGIYFVQLSAIRDPDLVLPTVAQNLEVELHDAVPVAQALASTLAGRRVLLILDNFEHVLAAADRLADLLQSAPTTKALVTSRAPLKLYGEQELPVGALATPTASAALTPEQALRYEAVRLFVDRASAVQPNFTPSRENVQAVVDLVARLEGLPLAIELAASRVKVLSPRGLLEKLDRRLEVLGGGPRDAPLRQQTLRATLSWSHDLLGDSERVMFRRLSVFRGGWDLEAAEALAGPDVSGLDALNALIDHSLIQRLPEEIDAPRFGMLETVREFALEQLHAAGEETDVRARHADHFMELAEAAETRLAGPERARWLDHLDYNHDNFREALSYLEATVEYAAAIRMSVGLWRFWEARGYAAEGAQRLDRLLERAPDLPLRLRSKALYATGVLADAHGNYEVARARFEENLALNRQLNDRWGVANSLNNLGIVALRQTDYTRARELYEEAIGIWREVGNSPAVALALNNLGNAAMHEGEHEHARELQEEALRLHAATGDRLGCAWSMSHLAEVALREGDTVAARDLYTRALDAFAHLDYAPGIASCTTELAEVMRQAGELQQARNYFNNALHIFLSLGDRRGLARVLEGYAALAVAQHDHARAVRLASFATALREVIATPLSPPERNRLDQALKWAFQSLDASTRQNEAAAGRAMSLDEALAYAGVQQ